MAKTILPCRSIVFYLNKSSVGINGRWLPLASWACVSAAAWEKI